MSKITKPYPGSEKAIDKGCRCPVFDNHKGRGFVMNGETVFIISEGCPLHDSNAKKQKPSTASAEMKANV